MKDPIKIIFKYKNNKKRLQYHIYVFVGKVPKQVMNVLNEIKNYDLYKTLTGLSKQKYQIIEKYYGEFWYKSFFNTYHIDSTTKTRFLPSPQGQS